MRKKSRRPFDPFTRLEFKDTLGRAMDEMAERLKAQGAAITHRKFAKTDHGFTHFGTVAVAREAFELLRDDLLAAYASPAGSIAATVSRARPSESHAWTGWFPRRTRLSRSAPSLHLRKDRLR